MNNTLTDSEIKAGLQQEDSQVCRYLFNKYYTPLLLFTRKLISDMEEARDIVTYVFQTFWSMRANFDTEVNIRAFMYITARNQCFNYLKYRQRQTTNKKVYNDSLLQSSDIDATESLIVQSDLVYKVYLQIQRLPEKYKEILIMTYYKGLGTNEIANELQISETNVTTRRLRALNLLREALSAKKDVPVFIIVLALACIENSHILADQKFL